MGLLNGNANIGSFNLSQIKQIKQLYQLMNTASNPQMALNQLANSNPQVRQAMQLCNGKSPKDVFYQLCKQKGVNPDDILNQLK